MSRTTKEAAWYKWSGVQRCGLSHSVLTFASPPEVPWESLNFLIYIGENNYLPGRVIGSIQGNYGFKTRPSSGPEVSFKEESRVWGDRYCPWGIRLCRNRSFNPGQYLVIIVSSN